MERATPDKRNSVYTCRAEGGSVACGDEAEGAGLGAPSDGGR
jgi:hypothetical protein